MQYTQEELDKLKNEPFAFTDDEEPAEEPIKPEVQEQVSVSPEEDAVPDKGRVPYSRFESVHERAIRAEERLKLLEEQQAGQVETKVDENLELPQAWKDLYGDDETSKKAYQIQINFENERLQQATEQIYERIQNKSKEEQEAVARNLEAIEDSLTKFQSETLKRDLTEAEESALLDIQDEFTPKDADGKYIAPLLSLDKAFEVYTLRQQQARSQKVQAKNRVVALTGAGSESSVSDAASEFRPGVRGQWRDSL